MSTLLTEFYTPVRAVLGDFSSVVRKYQDAAIADVLKTIVKCGQLGPQYTLASGDTVITPDVEGVDYGKLVYKAAKMFVGPNSAAYSYRTRALGETFGEQRIFIQQLEQALHEIDSEGGAMFGTQLGFRSWFLGMAGIDPWSEMTDMEVNAPVATVTIGASGVQVNT